MTSSATVSASYKEIVFSGNTSVVLHNSERLQFAACWAHARSHGIYEVSKENRYREKLLDMIQGLYDVNAREQGMGTQARTEHRQKYALPLLEVIKKYVDSLTEAEVLPKSDMAGALATSEITGTADSVCQQWSDSDRQQSSRAIDAPGSLGRKELVVRGEC